MFKRYFWRLNDIILKNIFFEYHINDLQVWDISD